MKNTKASKAAALLWLLSFFFAAPPQTAAQWVVYDPANFSQNVLSAVRAATSNANEARMIAQNVKSLANQARNLTSLPFDIINEFNGDLQSLFSIMGSIDGMMQNLATLEGRFEELYPDFLEQYDPVSRASMADDVRAWIKTTRQMILGASKTGAQVLENMPKTQEELNRLMADSQGAAGILQAAQAGNQIAGTISGNLISLNSQLAAYTQAHTAFLMELNSSAAAARNRMDHVLDGWEERYSGAALPENPF
jgi:type IV secretion system protein TrbJ